MVTINGSEWTRSRNHPVCLRSTVGRSDVLKYSSGAGLTFSPLESLITTLEIWLDQGDKYASMCGNDNQSHNRRVHGSLHPPKAERRALTFSRKLH